MLCLTKNSRDNLQSLRVYDLVLLLEGPNAIESGGIQDGARNYGHYYISRSIFLIRIQAALFARFAMTLWTFILLTAKNF